MKKFNLFNEIIVVNKQSLLNAINSTKKFAINTFGDVIYHPYTKNEALIFETQHTPKQLNALKPYTNPTLQDIFGKNYQIVEDDDRVLIKAFSNWQELIKLNTPYASYDDTTADGVSEFANQTLEDIGWNATEFDISYRELVETLEEKCKGTLLCIEQEEPYQFSGLGFLEDEQEAIDVLSNHCKEKIKNLINNDPLYKEENLTDDEIEAIEFFNSL